VEFLQWCLDRFAVGVWSTAMELNVVSMVEFLMGEAGRAESDLALVWNQAHCTAAGFGHPSNVHKPVMLKRMSAVWGEARLRGLYGPHNSLLLDDSPYKAALNPPNTSIHPPEWDANATGAIEDHGLGPGGPVRTFLEGLLTAPSVPDHVQHHDPFPEAARDPLQVDLVRRIRSRHPHLDPTRAAEGVGVEA